MNLKQLGYLLKIVDCCSITEAAQQLYVSQPGLTKAVLSLESEYGIRIFQRSHGGVTLTPEGKEFVYYAKNVLGAAQMLDQVFLNNDQDCRSKFFFATQPLDFLYDVILEMYCSNAESLFHFVITETDRCEVANKVLSGDAGLGLIVRSRYDGPSFPWNPQNRKLDIFSLDYSVLYACVGPLSPFYDADSITLEESHTVPNIIVSCGGAGASTLNLDTSISSFNRSQVVFCNSFGCCRPFLRHTNMLLTLTKWAVSSIDDPALRIIPITVPPEESKKGLPNELALIKRRGSRLTEKEAQFAHRLVQQFGRTPDPLFFGEGA